MAELIDRQENDGSYGQAVRLMQAMVADPESTPSARMLAELQRENCSFFELASALSENHRDYFANIAPLLEDRETELETEAQSSIERQREIEATDRLSFDEYLAHYFAGD